MLSLFSLITFESIHAGHEVYCHEENCPICLVLQIIKNTVKNAGSPLCLKAILHLSFEELVVSLVAAYFISLTPVTKKIKLTI
ncbi:MAG: hypothetical protein K6G80_10345 [Treponema sp.]|nr:hypothetical protein [Treponema sp.]